MKVTLRMLKGRGACNDHTELFRETFPETFRTGVEVTRDNLKLALSAGLDLDWCVALLRHGARRDAFCRARYDISQNHREAVSAIWAAHEKEIAPAMMARNSAIEADPGNWASAWSAYSNATEGLTRAAFDKVNLSLGTYRTALIDLILETVKDLK